ncbi:phosphatase PAP2 family protein [Bacteroides fragilis]|nr:phosphatase PAP2 family protein [Bacteroides fragilis]
MLFHLLPYLYIRSGCRPSVLFPCHRYGFGFAGRLSFHWRLFQSQSGVASRTRLSAWILLQPGGGLTASRRTSDCRFPSSHVGVSTILMIMAWRASKKLFACLMPFYLLLCGATVYIQAHYLIDAIAGFVSAFVLYVLVTKMFKKWFAVPMFK